MLAGGINSVSEEDDRFAAFDVIEVLIDYLIHHIVEPRSRTRPHLIDRSTQSVAIASRLGQYPDFVVERHHHHPIVCAQLIHESHCRILNVLQPLARRAAGVNQQGDREGLLGRSKVSDLLFHAVLPNPKVFFAQVRYVLAIAIHHGHGDALS